ncbi:MAG: conjugal transfer protein TrbL, partial [Bifidobacteriaceae bacterium]|nr:conjugal transfer protein TrbL [Bifidobacteriaceae bacterium]
MGVCDVPVISTVCDVAGEGAATLISAPFDWLAASMSATAGWVFEQVWNVFDTTTMVDVADPGYRRVYALVFGIACLVMLVFFALQLATAAVRREGGALRRAVTGLGKSVLGSFLALAVTGLLLEAVDQLCVGIVQAAGTTMADMGGRIALLAGGLIAINLASPGVGAIITIFLAGLAISAALVVWFSLLIRKALILVSVVLAPFALAGSAWDATRGWFPKWASFVVALITSKLVLVVVLLVAVTQTASPIAPDLQSVSEPMAGVVLMLIAAFAPYMTYKLAAFMGADMYHLMSAEQEAKHAVNRPLPVRIPAGNPRSVLPPSGGTGGAGSGGAPAPAPAAAPPAA